jgi:hypothetical protein
MVDQSTDVKRCVRCLLPATTPGLVIGSDGICSVCATISPCETLGEQALREALVTLKETG